MIFIDSSVFIAYYREEDTNHKKAVEIFKRVDKGEFGKAASSDYIFDESVTVTLVRTKNTKKAIALGGLILRGTILLKVHEHIFNEAWKLFKENELGLSFTDCTTLATMQYAGIQHLATFDRAFRKVEGIEVVE